MAMSATTANWHWKSKGVTPWARTWLESELPAVIFTSDDVTIGVSKVNEVDGDVELGMRKSKLLTIFDLRIVLAWSATHSNGAKASGTLTIPEVSHEIVVDGLSDYIYDWTLEKAAADLPAEPSTQTLLAQVKKQLPPKLTAVFESFPKVLLDTHGKDLVATPNASGQATPAAGGASTPAAAPTPAAVSSSLGAKPEKKEKKSVNTSTIRVEAQFMVSAADLFGYLTDETRIPAWTRAPAKSKPEAGGEFSLFGGGVVGKYTSVEKPTSFVQSWKLKSPTWPEDHEGKLTTTLEEQTDSTKLVLELQGVPKGQETEIERNLMGYYINSLKSIGYVPFNITSHTDVVTRKQTTVPHHRRSHSRSHRAAARSDGVPFWQVSAVGVLVVAVAVWTALAYYPL